MKLFPFGLYRVHGQSMAPTFKPDDLLLGSAWWPVPKVGHVAVVRRADRDYIKRITGITENGIWVEGDNPAASTDSRSFGYVRPRDVKAIIFFKL